MFVTENKTRRSHPIRDYASMSNQTARDAAAVLQSLLYLAMLISNDCLAAFIQDIDEQRVLIPLNLIRGCPEYHARACTACVIGLVHITHQLSMIFTLPLLRWLTPVFLLYGSSFSLILYLKHYFK